MKLIEDSLNKLISYIEKEKYLGYDPYDGLKSPFFKLPFLRNNKFIRFGFQQFIKRFPINLRSIFFIPKGYNPVTLGLCIQGYSRLAKAYPEKKNIFEQKVNFLVDELEKLIPEGYSGACWGYDFDWEARYSKIPGYQPTIVATGIITNGLFIAYETFGHQKAKNLCISASEFVLKDVKRTYDGNDFCFSYSPFDYQVVFNASMKGVRLLSQVYSITKEEKLKDLAFNAAAFVMKHQGIDGSWVYSMSGTGGWVDNYHTGYIIDCIDEFINKTGNISFSTNLQNGIKYYLDNFFEKDGIPKFYNKKIYPIDCTAASQSLLTLSRFNHLELGSNTAIWMIQNMQSEEGYFYFRKFRRYKMRQSFMRWSNAWMFAGLGDLCLALKSDK